MGATMNPFSELDLEKLKVITKRWVKQMRLQDGWFEEVTLHRYAAPHFRERTSLQYAVVFDVTHVEQPCGETLQALLAKYIEGSFVDPYVTFLSKTNYLKWLSLFTPKTAPEDKSDDPLAIHARRFAEQSGMGTPPPFVDNEVDFPPSFNEKDFIYVYRGCPPDNWTKQWLFIPLFKDCLLPDQIQKDESTVLYSRLVVTLNEIFKTPMRVDRATQEEQAENIGTSSSNSSIEEGFYSILKKYHTDIGVFWKLLSRKAKQLHGSIEVAQESNLYDLAREVFKENSHRFIALKQADIDNRDFYSNNIKPKRKVVGSILQKIVWRECPEAFSHPEIKNNIQWLFEQFKKTQT